MAGWSSCYARQVMPVILNRAAALGVSFTFPTQALQFESLPVEADPFPPA